MMEIWNAKDIIWAYFGEGFYWEDFKMFYLVAVLSGKC